MNTALGPMALARLTCATIGRQAGNLNPRLKLAMMGFVQVIFVSANVSFISHYQLLGNVITAFFISFIWTYNVKRIAFGDSMDRWAYAIGAALGSVTGTILANGAL